MGNNFDLNTILKTQSICLREKAQTSFRPRQDPKCQKSNNKQLLIFSVLDTILSIDGTSHLFLTITLSGRTAFYTD